MKITNEGWAIIEGDTYLSAQIESQGRLDVVRDEWERFRKFVPAGGVVVDAGASLGDTAAVFSEMVGASGLVYAFEPQREVYECLVHNTKGFPNVIPMSFGLGSEIEGTNLNVDSNNSGASRLERGSANEHERCHVRPMDSLELKRLDFIKIDTEGWEPLVLDGAQKTVNKFRPVIVLEVNTWMLDKMGFKAADIWARLDALKYHYEKFDGPYGDVLCLPKEEWIQVQ